MSESNVLVCVRADLSLDLREPLALLKIMGLVNSLAEFLFVVFLRHDLQALCLTYLSQIYLFRSGSGF